MEWYDLVTGPDCRSVDLFRAQVEAGALEHLEAVNVCDLIQYASRDVLVYALDTLDVPAPTPEYCYRCAAHLNADTRVMRIIEERFQDRCPC